MAQYKSDKLPYDQCTHIIYAFVVLDSSTLLMKSHDKWLDVDLKNLKKVSDLKLKNPNLKVINDKDDLCFKKIKVYSLT